MTLSNVNKAFSWFLLGDESEEVPFSYRAWKWLLQKRYAGGWDGDLFTRIDTVEWDLLIILDACRYDVLTTVADCAVVEKCTSPVSGTPAFLRTAQNKGVFDGTTYVSANPQTEKYSPGDVEHISLSENGWDEQLATVPPGEVYERALKHVRAGKRVVAHTIQPHYPHICEVDGRTIPVQGGLHPAFLTADTERYIVQSILARGLVDLETARQSYLIAVKYAWDKAKMIGARLANEGYSVVITADHGEAFGELGLVEHPSNIGIRSLREVPWVMFAQSMEFPLDESVEDRLSALGYK